MSISERLLAVEPSDTLIWTGRKSRRRSVARALLDVDCRFRSRGLACTALSRIKQVVRLSHNFIVHFSPTEEHDVMRKQQPFFGLKIAKLCQSFGENVWRTGCVHSSHWGLANMLRRRTQVDAFVAWNVFPRENKHLFVFIEIMEIQCAPCAKLRTGFLDFRAGSYMLFTWKLSTLTSWQRRMSEKNVVCTKDSMTTSFSGFKLWK